MRHYVDKHNGKSYAQVQKDENCVPKIQDDATASSISVLSDENAEGNSCELTVESQQPDNVTVNSEILGNFSGIDSEFHNQLKCVEEISGEVKSGEYLTNDDDLNDGVFDHHTSLSASSQLTESDHITL